ncbi:hypothetical protein OKW21_004940 [Catalinimonas alkaloidigena]|uniref:hypothetical protein n=1 Tax=Catalinimonas alkaloidigena TaxID=1075417 RepID=UPI0024053B71|nr:hypothetical protein [Catalinimonas alkaloidigena]MDF9799677.1 hypothetical protein [Catalinimonas alkaloidigena]
MGLAKIIDKISSREDIITKPPVLVDIGASNDINPVWKKIASFSIGLAFDADDRDFEFIEKEDKLFKKLYVFNKIVVDKAEHDEMDFYLTKSPYCSSLLEPNLPKLQPYHYADFFEVTNKIKLKIVELKKVIEEIGIDYVDWFKTDAQGIDLRLFSSLSQQMQNKTIMLEFEPGLIDAYKQEDKVVDVLNYMRDKEFFLLSLDVKGPFRITKSVFDHTFKSQLSKKFAKHGLKRVPGWAEMAFLNELTDPDCTAREYILAWLFSTLQEHHEISAAYAHQGYEKFGEKIFQDLEDYSFKAIKNQVYSLNTLSKIGNIALNKIKSFAR